MCALTYEETLKMNDIQKKMTIVKNVVKACFAEKDANTTYLTNMTNSSNNISLVNAIRHYTGIELKVITTYLSQYLNTPSSTQTFVSWYEKYEANQLIEKEWNPNLRECIMFHYFKADRLPTIAVLRSRKDIFPNCCSDDEVRRILKMSFFVQHKVEGTSKVIYIEDPERTVERFRYLEAKERYRASNLNFVYINSNKLQPIEKSSWDYIAISTKEGVLGTLILCQNDNLEKHEKVESWILEDILPQLLSQSVLVLEDNIDIQEGVRMPTIQSSKEDMINWLTLNNIVHEDDMHRAELYELIKKSKRNTPNTINAFDTKVNAKGHKVVRQPKGVTCLNYFKKVWVQLLKSKSADAIMGNAQYSNGIVKRKQEYWAMLERHLVMIERKMYSEDVALENVIDSVLTLAKYSPASKHLFNACDNVSKDLKLENFIEM